MDTLHWGANWTPEKDFLDRIREAVKNENWIIDGNYREAARIVLPRATMVIFLNLPFSTVFFRSLFRTTKRVLSKEELHNGNRETFTGGFLSAEGIPVWVIRTYHRRKKRFIELKEKPEYSHLAFIELSSMKEINEFIEKVRSLNSAGNDFAVYQGQ